MKTSTGYFVQRSSKNGFGVFSQRREHLPKGRHRWHGPIQVLKWFWAFDDAWKHAESLAGHDSICFDSTQLP